MMILYDKMSYIFEGYYSCMRVLLETKVPDSIEKTVTPPTPIAATIFDLIRAPLSFVSEGPTQALRCEILVL